MWEEIGHCKEITQLCRRGWDYVWVEACFATSFLKTGKTLAIEENTPGAHYNLEHSVNFSHFRVVGMEAGM